MFTPEVMNLADTTDESMMYSYVLVIASKVFLFPHPEGWLGVPNSNSTNFLFI